MKKIKDILFVSNAIQFAERTYPIGKRLSDKGYSVLYATYSKECLEYFKKKGIEAIFILNDLLSFDPKDKLEHYLEYYEKKYNVTSMNLLVLGDRNYTRKGRKKALIGLVQHFKYWEDFFSKHKIDLIIGGTERFINEVPRAIIKKNGGIQISAKVQPLPNTFVYSTDHLGRISSLDKYWEKNKNKKITNEEKKWVEDYINKTIEEKRGVYLIFKAPSFESENIKLFFRRVYVNLFKEKMRNPYADIFKIAKELGVRAIRKNFTRFYYEQPKDEKYIYYPLHRSADAAILARAPQYVDQISFVQNLANYLPVEYKLYVKEHPSGIGELKLKELKKLKSFPNVRLIEPKTSSHDLIKKATCVFTINSNAGWEALLYKKPVITFGTSFYDKSGLVFPLRDFYEFNNTFKLAINSKFDYEKLLRFIAALHKVVKTGNIEFVGSLAETLEDEKNLDSIAEGIVSQIKELETENDKR